MGKMLQSTPNRLFSERTALEVAEIRKKILGAIRNWTWNPTDAERATDRILRARIMDPTTPFNFEGMCLFRGEEIQLATQLEEIFNHG